jgi:NAD(P)-dependent dehydrogenase (short-subunit alcohol dehydrogenase family)
MYKEMFDLGGRVAVVVGGGRNIGLACCEALAEHGARAVIAEIDERVGAEGVDYLKGRGLKAELLPLDVTKPAEVTAAAEAIAGRHGRVDILVSCAGVCFNTPAEDCPDEEWRKVLDVNLNGTFWANRAFGRQMLKAGKGSIVNVGSMSGIIANKPQPQAHYNASKAAVHMLTKSLAVEWASRGVRVNAVAPTYIATAMTRRGMENAEWHRLWLEMTPMARVGQSPEIASAVLYCASDASSLMTGEVMVVDGGYTCW